MLDIVHPGSRIRAPGRHRRQHDLPPAPVPPRPVVATPVPGVPSDWDVTSFDGTKIRAHWFPVHPGSAQRSPTVLMGPGWSLSGDTDTQGSGVLGQIPIKALWAAGYNVLTWDPRGFGKSGGEAEVDSPDYEARDVSSLIDWVATRPGVELDAPGDPRMGMVGGSYGGGIQLVTAATDCRIDAIVPTIAWHSLVTSLDKADTFKAGWGNILANLSSSDHVDPEVKAGPERPADLTGTITPAERSGLRHGARATWCPGSSIPTLIVQGTVDTLFTLQEGVENYEILRQRRRAHRHDLVLWGPRGVPDPTGQPGAAGHRHHRLVEPIREAGHLGQHRPRVPVRRPERHQLLRQQLSRPHRRSRSAPTGTGRCPWWPPADRGRPTSRAARRSWPAWSDRSPRPRPPTRSTSTSRSGAGRPWWSERPSCS